MDVKIDERLGWLIQRFVWALRGNAATGSRNVEKERANVRRAAWFIVVATALVVCVFLAAVVVSVHFAVKFW